MLKEFDLSKDNSLSPVIPQLLVMLTLVFFGSAFTFIIIEHCSVLGSGCTHTNTKRLMHLHLQPRSLCYVLWDH